MNQGWRDAAEQGSIDALYALIRTNANVLDSIDKIPFVDTPLHIAASLGHTHFAMEIMKLKPSFARKLNQDGFSPMHLALQKLHELENNPALQRNLTISVNHDSENDHALQRNLTISVNHDSENDHALQRNLTILVHRLLDVDKDLVRVRGREGVTPLHYVAQIGNLKFFIKFFEVCPESFEDVTIRRETALHIALKSDKVEAFVLLLKRLRRAWFKDAELLEEKVLYWEDEEGNTLLHVAVSKNQPKVVSSLLDSGSVNLKAKNLKGRTVFDILGRQSQEDSQRRIREMLTRHAQNAQLRNRLATFVDYFRSHRSGLEKYCVGIRRQQTLLTDEKRNALLVVAVLLITIIYQIVLSPETQLQPNEFNCTAPINATGANHNQFNCTGRFNPTIGDVNPSQVPDSLDLFLLGITCLTYFLTNAALCFLLPPHLIGMVLYSLLLLLFIIFFSSSTLFPVVMIGIFLFYPLASLPLLTVSTDRPAIKDFPSFNIA